MIWLSNNNNNNNNNMNVLRFVYIVFVSCVSLILCVPRRPKRRDNPAKAPVSFSADGLFLLRTAPGAPLARTHF